MRVRTIPAHPSTYTAGRGAYAPQAIVVHYTGGRGLAGGETAEANGVYFSGGNRGASAHYFVDGSGEVVASVPEADTAWHAGNFNFNRMSIGIEVVSDGSDFTEGELRDLRELVQDIRRRWAIPAWHAGNFNFNRMSIGIEVVSDGSDFTEGELRDLRELVQDIRRRWAIPAENVMRHYDCYDFAQRWGVGGSWVDPNKACPLPYVDHAKWHRDVWLRVAPDGMPEPAPEVPAPETAPDAPEPERKYLAIEPGTYRCTVDHLRVRTGPGLGFPEVAHYDEGEAVELDGWCVEADGYIWGTYVGEKSGERRYVAVGRPTGGPDASDYLVLA